MEHSISTKDWSLDTQLYHLNLRAKKIKSSKVQPEITDKKLLDYITKEYQFILKLMRAFGVIPISFNKIGFPTFSIWSYATIYCVLLYLTLLGVLFNQMTKIIPYIIKHRFHFNNLIITFTMISVITPACFLSPTQWSKTKTTIQYIRQWLEINLQLHSLIKSKGVDPLVLDKPIIKVSIFFTMLFVTLFAFNTLWKIFKIWEIFFIWLQIAIEHVIIFYWVLVTKNLKLFALYFENNYIKLIHQEDPEFHISFRQLWIKLNHLTSDLCAQFCYSLGYLLVNLCIGFILLIYALILTYNESILRAFMFLFTGCYFLFLIYVICIYPDDTVYEMGENFKVKLLEIYDKNSKLSQKEIIKFINTINDDSPKINFLGYTLVNRMLFLSVSGNIFSYLILLCQLVIGKNITRNGVLDDYQNAMNP